MWTSSYGYPQQKRRSADIEIRLAILVEAVTPLTIPQFWPPNSLDYRSELLLPDNSEYSRIRLNIHD